MGGEASVSLVGCFSELRDPRVDRTKRHELVDILAIAICAVVCGADSWVDVEEFGQAKEGWLRTFLELPNGIPSHDTFGDVFSCLDGEQFEACFRRWMQGISQLRPGEVIAIDGKTLGRSHDKAVGKGAIQMVSAWASANQLVLGQRKVDEGSNEITAIPELLAVLAIEGCLVTIDAMGCQREIAEQIVDRGGDYLLALKGNQEELYEDARLLFDDLQRSQFKAYKHDYAQTVEKDHGRLEIRRCWTIADADCLGYFGESWGWKGLRKVVKVEAERRYGGERMVESRYYLSSSMQDAAKMLAASRHHWGIENSLHWVLDVAFQEDDSRVRKGHGAENLAILRRIALNLLKQETTTQVSIKAKRLKAGWSEAYLRRVLSGLSQ